MSDDRTVHIAYVVSAIAVPAVDQRDADAIAERVVAHALRHAAADCDRVIEVDHPNVPRGKVGAAPWGAPVNVTAWLRSGEALRVEAPPQHVQAITTHVRGVNRLDWEEFFGESQP